MKILGLDVSTIYTFLLALVAKLAAVFVSGPAAMVLGELSWVLTTLGAVLHLDGVPNFKIDGDTIFAFALALVSHLGTLFATNPAVITVLTAVGNILTVLGGIFHLDGHMATNPAPAPPAK